MLNWTQAETARPQIAPSDRKAVTEEANKKGYAMPFNPYTFSTKRMGAHVYSVEGGVDLTPWGFPGVTFEGDVDIDIEGEAQNMWYVGAVHALDAKGNTHHYDLHQGIGEAVVAALYADTFHSQMIEDACWYHGED